MNGITIFWHRRDLRLEDNAGLFHALKAGRPVLPLFIFDKHILDKLEDKDDARVSFIHEYLTKIHQQLQDLGSSILVKIGNPLEVWQEIIANHQVEAVFTNRDYEPYAKERDAAVKDVLQNKGIEFHDFKDHVILEAGEVLKKDGTPYTVYTPFSRKWREKCTEEDLASFPTEDFFDQFLKTAPIPMPSLAEVGFEPTSIAFPSITVPQGIVRNYDKTRNFPGIRGTSQLGVHFRFGTISIREKARKAAKINDTYFNELIWREFYSMILAHFPKVVTAAFRAKYDYIEWRNNEEEFDRWCKGQTGYPIVDAGMRELNATGYMHNRVRMIVASFLTKHLLIDWRWGEAYFARKLLDFDLSTNNGGWQWAAGSGTDAAPYFRIFNPISQMQKFDKEKTYIKKWVPEFGTPEYVDPVVDHKFARERCLETYKSGLDMAAKV